MSERTFGVNYDHIFKNGLSTWWWLQMDTLISLMGMCRYTRFNKNSLFYPWGHSNNRENMTNNGNWTHFLEYLRSYNMISLPYPCPLWKVIFSDWVADLAPKETTPGIYFILGLEMFYQLTMQCNKDYYFGLLNCIKHTKSNSCEITVSFVQKNQHDWLQNVWHTVSLFFFFAWHPKE